MKIVQKREIRYEGPLAVLDWKLIRIYMWTSVHRKCRVTSRRGQSTTVPCANFCSICLASACGTPSCVARIVIRYIW